MRGIYSFFIIVFVLCSCSYESYEVIHFDYLTVFVVQGVVRDLNNRAPIAGAKVFFIDTGYDYSRSQPRSQVEIGTTDLEGRIDIKFDYGWSSMEGANYEIPKRTFEILISRESFKEEVVCLKETDLTKKGNTVYVELPEIYLVPNGI
jgi:hypothetical protein